MVNQDWRQAHAPELIGDDQGLVDVLSVAERVAQTDCTVLLTGESGTGKDLLARAIHRASDRSQGNFVPVNCGAIPESLLESELFGHVRGAFTGAVASRVGRFAMADGGTMFLDEIGEMPLHLQAKLLRVLQEKEYSPVGDSKTYTADVRIIAATNRDLEEMVDRGEFRADLFWRLNVVPLEVPALRDRNSDVERLCDHFMASYNERHGRAMEGIAPCALDIMKAYDWPGNVRQLENLIQRVVVVKGSGYVEAGDLPPRMQAAAGQARASSPTELPENGIDLRDAVEEFENGLIIQALERTSWNKNRAANLLQLNRTTLVEKLKKKGLTDRTAVVAAA